MVKRLVMLCFLGALVPLSAMADGVAVTSYGPRVGFSTGPDQLVLGGQMSVGDVAENLSFDPNIELGFGDDVTLICFNLDMHYHFTINDSSWRPYAGAGVGINFIQVDVPPGFGGDDTSTKVGGSFIFGAAVPTKSNNHFFGELKLGLGDNTPDLKMLVGWNFGR